MKDQLLIMIPLLVGILMGIGIAFPYKIYVITVIEKVGSAVPHREFVFLSRKRAKKMYKELRLKALETYISEAPSDWSVPEDYNIDGTELQRNQKLSITDDIGYLMARVVVRCPFNDYGDKEMEIELRYKYLS